MCKRKYYLALVALLLAFPVWTYAQQEVNMTREERIKTLEALRMEDRKWETATSQATQNVPDEIVTMKLPPLSVFLDAVAENATVKRAQSQVEQLKNEYRLQKRDWLGYLRFNGMYSYGRYNVLSNNSDEFTPMYQTSMTNNQQTFNVGASINFSLGDILNRPLKLKNYRYQIEQLEFAQDEVMEERKLRVLEAYNAVTEQLAVIKAKAESAALYNAQMKISENYFIQGRIDIITLSLERARRSAAVVQYEESRVALHNAIVLLEMLTNIKIIKEG